MTPEKWAFRLTHLLNHRDGPDRFPINISELAHGVSSHFFKHEPITKVEGKDIPGFDGALVKDPHGKKGWAIFYNSGYQSKGRINFTLAHELGHYLLHKDRYPDGIQCSERAFTRWESEFGQVEHQANVFAATLLMPLDDYRRQIPDNSKVSMDLLDHVTNRYEVSLLAALLRWLEYTTRRAVLVVSTDGFILWSKPSQAALRTGAFFRTANVAPVEIPPLSIAARSREFDQAKAREGIKHGPGVWFPDACEEITIFADQYHFTISIIQLY